MPARPRSPDGSLCEWVTQADALRRFATHTGGTQSARQIKPLHWYIACRLVLEGGFNPDHITPRPPFVVTPQRVRTQSRPRFVLSYDPAKGGTGEQVILGGLKTKNVDVVVTNPTVGPVVAISCKGTTKAFRNLPNRMEETIGECTNLHITYPAMVIGYFALLRANRTLQDALDAPATDERDANDSGVPLPSDDGVPPIPLSEPARTRTGLIEANDIAILPGPGRETVAVGIRRFHDALSEMTSRQGIRDEISRYEAMAIVLVEPRGADAGAIFPDFPPPGSALHHERFFQTLYQRYEERFAYGAPLLAERNVAATTARFEWDPESPALHGRELNYTPRVAAA